MKELDTLYVLNHSNNTIFRKLVSVRWNIDPIEYKMRDTVMYCNLGQV